MIMIYLTIIIDMGYFNTVLRENKIIVVEIHNLEMKTEIVNSICSPPPLKKKKS